MSNKVRSFISPLHVAVALLLQVSSGAVVSAQDSTYANAATQKSFCFRGRALPHCQAFAITEFGGAVRVYGQRTDLQYRSPYDTSVITYSWRPPVFSATGEVGAMYNATARDALGGAIFLRNGSGGQQFGFKARYRRWLTSDGTALDVAAGVANGDGGSGKSEGIALDMAAGVMNGDGGSSLSNDPAFGVTGDIAINFQDYAALYMRIDLNRTQHKTRPALYAGVRAGSFPALGAAALVGTGFAVLFALFAAGGVD